MRLRKRENLYAYSNAKGIIYVVGMLRGQSLIGRYVCWVTPYNDYWRSCQQQKKKRLKNIFYANERLYIENESQLLGFINNISEVAQKKTFLLINFIRSTIFKESIME